MTEQVGVEFRAEYFNFTNTPHFDRPDSTLSNAGFGEVTTAVADQRQIQFGLKITFIESEEIAENAKVNETRETS